MKSANTFNRRERKLIAYALYVAMEDRLAMIDSLRVKLVRRGGHIIKVTPAEYQKDSRDARRTAGRCQRLRIKVLESLKERSDGKAG